MSIQSTGASHDPGIPGRPLSVTIRRACEITGLGTTTLYQLIKQGRVETYKIGRRTLVKYASLESLAA